MGFGTPRWQLETKLPQSQTNAKGSTVMVLLRCMSPEMAHRVVWRGEPIRRQLGAKRT